jgi:membrane fusion protein (multidrug efflux system)
MKYLSILTVVLLLAACGGNKEQSVEEVIASQDLTIMKSTKDNLETQKQTLSDQIVQLEEEIKKLSPESKVPLITYQKLEAKVFNHYLELQGNVSTKKNIVLYPEYGGILTNVYVKAGQNVSKGQTLARISDGGLSQQLAQMEIQTSLAKTSFERQKSLWDQNIGTEMQYLQSKSTYEAQQKAVSQMEVQLSKTVIRAPFSGVIDDVITEQGSMVNPGQTQIMRIINLRDMYIETDVPERHIKTITRNKTAEVEFPIIGKTIKTKVRQVGNFINPANRTFKVEIAVPSNDKSIKPNLTARVKINDYTSKEAILIPQSIVSEDAKGKQYVYMMTDKKETRGVAKKVFIETGLTDGDLIEIVKGLSSGDDIIIEGARSIREGQTVKFLK